MEEEEKEKKVVGLTKNVGFQFSITKTCAVSVDAAWDFLLSESGIAIWLGSINFDDFELNHPLTTKAGIEAKITIFKADSHLRLAWKPAHWDNISFIEIRVLTNKGRAKLGLLHTHMMNLEQREEVKIYWDRVFQQMDDEIKKKC
jgi:activator of HSP90 ATPase